MISKTKFELEDKKIRELFAKAGINGITEISPLSAGEFNAVYQVNADKSYVLKIAPGSDAPVMTYEKNMMQSEVNWYRLISENTDIRVPEIYFSDFTKELIPADYFIMEKLEGRHKNEIKTDSSIAISKTAQMVAQIHKIHGGEFGYIQNGLHPDWYSALGSMIENIISDCEKVGKRTKKGEELLRYADKYKDILKVVPCSMVNYDLWDPNILCTVDEKGEIHYSWIDPERSFWGDFIFDFICLENCVLPLKAKTKSIEAYNKFSEQKVTLCHETEIRYAFAQCFMGLIQEVEKYYRYTPKNFGWWRNILASSAMYSAGFKVLKNG